MGTPRTQILVSKPLSPLEGKEVLKKSWFQSRAGKEQEQPECPESGVNGNLDDMQDIYSLQFPPHKNTLIAEGKG